MTESTIDHAFRKNAQAIAAILDELDRTPDENGPAAKSRAVPRFEFRMERVLAEVEKGPRHWSRVAAISRNISAGGLAFVTNSYLYANMRCRFHLPTLDGRTQIVSGHVVHCRYVEGSGNIYLVGVRFDEELDVGRLTEKASNARLLILDPQPTTARLILSLLKRTSARGWHASSADEAVTRLAEDKVDLVLVNLDSGEEAAIEAASAVRKAGFVGALLAMSSSPTRELHQKILAAGCSGFFQNPVTREALEAVLISARTDALRSSLSGDPDLAPLIEEFVTGLPDLVRGLEEEFPKEDRRELIALARNLRGTAGSLGFEPIGEAAAELERSAATGADAAGVRRCLNEVSRLCSAARGAA